MEDKKIFSFSNYGYNTSEVDEYISFIQSELTRNMIKVRDFEQQDNNNLEEFDKLKKDNEALLNKNNELYSDCVNFAKRLKEIEAENKEKEAVEASAAEEKSGVYLDEESVKMFEEIKNDYSRLINENKDLNDNNAKLMDQLAVLQTENASLKTNAKISEDVEAVAEPKPPVKEEPVPAKLAPAKPAPEQFSKANYEDVSSYTEDVVAQQPRGIYDVAEEPQEFYSSTESENKKSKKNKNKLSFGFHLSKVLLIILLVLDILLIAVSCAYLIIYGMYPETLIAGYDIAALTLMAMNIPVISFLTAFALTHPYIWMIVLGCVLVFCIVFLALLAHQKKKIRNNLDFNYTDDDFSLKI